MAKSGLPTVPVRVNGKVYNIVICWDAEKSAAACKRYQDGIIDLDNVKSDQYDGPANELERIQFIAMVERVVAGKELATTNATVAQAVKAGAKQPKTPSIVSKMNAVPFTKPARKLPTRVATNEPAKVTTTKTAVTA